MKLKSKQFTRQIAMVFFTAMALPSQTTFANQSDVQETNTEEEFDALFLDTRHASLTDTSMFSRGNPISAGNKRLDIFVNEQWRGIVDVLYLPNPKDPYHAILCADKNLVEKFGLKSELKEKVLASQSSQGCLDINGHVKGFMAYFDASKLRLNIEIPKIFIQNADTDIINPELWDSGVNTVFANYQFNHYQSKQDVLNRTNQSTFLGLNTGVNVGRWHFRHNGAFSWNNNQQDPYQVLSTYVKHDIPAWRSQLIFGDISSSGQLFDSTSMRGVQISSDDRMLPMFMRYYVPIVRGIAHSNANVSVYQNNNLVFNTTVPAGEFEIQDIKNISDNGDLYIVITEADGTRRESVVRYNSNSQLLRPNHQRYSATFGRVRHDNTKLYDNKTFQGTWQYGVNNYWTFNTGTILSDDYQSALLGGVFNTPIGLIGVNAITARYQFDKNFANNQLKNTGHQIHLQYNKFFDSTKTGVNFYVQRHQNYLSLGDFAAADNQNVSPRNLSEYTRLQLSLNQNFNDTWGSLYALISRSYQKNEPSATEWQLSYHNRFKRINYSISASQNKSDLSNRWDKQFMLSISLPLDSDMKHQWYSHYAHQNRKNDLSSTKDENIQVGVIGSLRKLSTFNYGVSANYQDNQINSWSANANYGTPFALLNGTFSKNNQNNQFSFGASGSVVAHRPGFIFSNTLGETFGIVHAPEGDGAKISTSNNLKLNRQGYAVIPYLSAYQINNVVLDPQGLPIDVQLDSTTQQTIPRADSSVLVQFNSRISRTALFNFKLSDGKAPLVGANIFNEKHQHMGFVAQGGRAFLQDLSESGELTLHWYDFQTHQERRCTANYQLPQKLPTDSFVSITSICQ